MPNNAFFENFIRYPDDRERAAIDLYNDAAARAGEIARREKEGGFGEDEVQAQLRNLVPANSIEVNLLNKNNFKQVTQIIMDWDPSEGIKQVIANEGCGIYYTENAASMNAELEHLVPKNEVEGFLLTHNQFFYFTRNNATNILEVDEIEIPEQHRDALFQAVREKPNHANSEILQLFTNLTGFERTWRKGREAQKCGGIQNFLLNLIEVARDEQKDNFDKELLLQTCQTYENRLLSVLLKELEKHEPNTLDIYEITSDPKQKMKILVNADCETRAFRTAREKIVALQKVTKTLTEPGTTSQQLENFHVEFQKQRKTLGKHRDNHYKLFFSGIVKVFATLATAGLAIALGIWKSHGEKTTDKISNTLKSRKHQP